MNTNDDEVWDMETNYDTPSLRTCKNELLIFTPVAKTWKQGKNVSLQLPVKGGTIPTFCTAEIWKYLPNSQREFETAFHKLHSRHPRKNERPDRMIVLHEAVPLPPLSLLTACPDSLQYGGRISQTKAVKINNA